MDATEAISIVTAAHTRGAAPNLRGANLRGADLRGANLCGAYLRDADLRDANLRDAYLRDADLRGAYLRDADLRDADLRSADLRGANLRGANLCGAYLRDADLRDADLRDADLRSADLGKGVLLQIGPIGSRRDRVTYLALPDGTETVATGCWRGSVEEFRAQVAATHGDNEHAQAYMAVLDLLARLREIRTAHTTPPA